MTDSYLWQEEHNSANTYPINSQVKVTENDIVKIYISTQEVPTGILITNTSYWEYQYMTIHDESIVDQLKIQTIVSTEPPVGIAPEGTEWIMYR